LNRKNFSGLSLSISNLLHFGHLKETEFLWERLCFTEKVFPELLLALIPCHQQALVAMPSLICDAEPHPLPLEGLHLSSGLGTQFLYYVVGLAVHRSVSGSLFAFPDLNLHLTRSFTSA